MRVLVVYHDCKMDVQELIVNQCAGDIKLFTCGKERQPEGEELIRYLRSHPGIEVGFVGVSRQYRRNLCATYGSRQGLDRPRFDRGQLIAWLGLGPAAVPPVEVALPSAAFSAVAAEQKRLVIGTGALREADRIDAAYHQFVGLAARALGDYAANPAVGSDLAQFFARKLGSNTKYAPAGGDIMVRYTVYGEDGTRVGSEFRVTERHLLDGPRGFTRRVEIKPRIYFERIEDHHGCISIAVLKCGPHPSGSFPPVDVHLRWCGRESEKD